ncbi:MAG: hypothetical protein EXS21_06145 [Pedosphaera sp.]|nr:hypothetical protein [Pedosphaera sp.]
MKGWNRFRRKLGWFVFFVAVSVWACRYSVRDTGFVDLGLEAYRLRWVPESGASAEVRSKAELLLRDSNVVWDEDPAGEGFPRTAGLYLRDVEGRILSLPLPNPSDATAVLRGVEMAVTSPLRERVYREGLRAYALVLLLEGTDGEANARVRQDVESAITATARLLSSMPKPVETPPQLVAVSLKEQATERVLVWGLGLDPASTDSPRVVLVFGRGRRLGLPLEGPLITQTALRDRLLLIGQDCECDLDRAWLKGPLLPGRWGRDLQQAALDTLGFDPGNPMVRAEISRIVERGPQNPGRRRPPSSGTSLGYSEESVETVLGSESDPAEPPNTQAAVDTSATSTDPTALTSSTALSKSPPAPTPTNPGRGLWFVLAGALTVFFAVGLGLWFRASKR